jgi:hypothetical protein
MVRGVTGKITSEELERLWAKGGLRDHVLKFWRYLVENGLMPMVVPEISFANHIKDRVLFDYLVRDKGKVWKDDDERKTGAGDSESGAAAGRASSTGSSGVPPSW